MNQQGQGEAQRLISTHREGRGNWTQVEHMRTGADNHRDRKWRKHTRNRAYKIKQETENMRHPNNSYTNINTRMYKKHEVIIKQKTLLIKWQKNTHTLKNTKPWHSVWGLHVLHGCVAILRFLWLPPSVQRHANWITVNWRLWIDRMWV